MSDEHEHKAASECGLVQFEPNQYNKEGVNRFLGAYYDAPSGAEIDVVFATAEDDDTLHIMIVTLAHPKIEPMTVVLSAAQARMMANVADDLISILLTDAPAGGGPADLLGLPELVKMLREAADDLETAFDDLT